jgi:hypothetical protein
MRFFLMSVRYHDSFAIPGAAKLVLGWWVSLKNSATAKKDVLDWALEFMASCVAKEARSVTKSGDLQTSKKMINRQLVESFELEEYTDKLAMEWAPTATAMISAFATSRNAAKHTEPRKEKTALVWSSFCALSSELTDRQPGQDHGCSDVPWQVYSGK